jgi:hypothetical protein
MKLIQRLTLLSSIALLAGACDLQQTFDERIDDKQLLVLTPDFADTSVQLVFRDPETLAVLDEDFEVTVYSNKRLVDLNGNYKNEFIARGGVMEFSVSPEETVSESDPLEIGVSAKNEDNSKLLSFSDHTIKAPDFTSINLIPAPNEYTGTEILDESIIDPSREQILSKSASDLKFELNFNGNSINDKPMRCDFICYLGNIIASGQKIYKFSPGLYYTFEGLLAMSGFVIANYEPGEPPNSLVLVNDLDIEVVGPTSLAEYVWSVEFWDSNKDFIKYTIFRNGSYSVGRYSRIGEILTLGGGRLSTNHSVTLPAGNYPGKFKIDTYPKDTYKECDEGFNLLIEGATPGLNTNLMYKATRKNDGKILGIANLNFSESSFLYNSLQDGGVQKKQYISTSGNTLEFAENSQYIIEPSVIDLGGEELCGNTYTVTLKPRDTHKKHQLNLSMRNENQNVGLALTFSALLRKQGQGNTSWETINFKQGSASVYLEEGSTYEVKLTLADEPFEFTFTNDLSLVEAAVQATKRNVTRIKDINYRIEQTTDMNTIDAEIVFFEGQSLID